jgi:hypothetical protein
MRRLLCSSGRVTGRIGRSSGGNARISVANRRECEPSAYAFVRAGQTGTLPAMGYVTSLFARKMVAAAGCGSDAAALLRGAGIDPDGPWDPRAMIPAGSYYDMLERIAAQVDVTALPVRAGASMRLDEYGALGLAFKAATTLGASYARVERYARLWTSVVEYELRADPRGTLFILHRPGERRLGLRLSNEATLASAVSIARQVSPAPVAPLEVLVRHAAPKSVAAHEDWFGCPVRFGADLDAILFSPETLARPNILGDAGISRFLTSHLDRELSEIADEAPLVRQAKDAIAQALSEGAPKMADIARASASARGRSTGGCPSTA